jgi:transposase-like protein
MGQVLHSRARTTEEVRRDIQNSKESLATLAKRYNINPKTVTKWRKRQYTHDTPMGPKNPRSTVLTVGEEAAIVAFRKHTLLPIDDCLYTLQETIPKLTRSSLYRCFKRHGINQLPKTEETQPAKKKFNKYPAGYLHIDIAQVYGSEL